MRFVHLLTFLALCLLNPHGAHGLVAKREAVDHPPSCSLPCLDTYISEFCGTLTNATCICTSTDFLASIDPCLLQRCNLTESMRLQKYSAETCGVTNDRTRLDEVLDIDYIVPALVMCFVIGRLCARKMLNVGMGADDWVMLAAVLAYLLDVLCSLGLALNGFGQHTYWLDKEDVTTALKFFYVVELFYIAAITLTKLSLLLFFLRIFPSRKFRQFVWCFGAFVSASNILLLLALTFQCIPFHGYWTNWQYKIAPVQCIDQFAALYAVAGFSLFQNIVILIMPIKTLWQLNLVWQKKLSLLGMFSVGSMVVVCSFLRLPSLNKLNNGSDVSYDQAPIIVYSHLEQGVGIICACLPACRSLVEYLFPRLKMSWGSSVDRSGTCEATTMGGKHTRSFIELGDRQATQCEMSIEEMFGAKRKEDGGPMFGNQTIVIAGPIATWAERNRDSVAEGTTGSGREQRTSETGARNRSDSRTSKGSTPRMASHTRSQSSLGYRSESRSESRPEGKKERKESVVVLTTTLEQVTSQGTASLAESLDPRVSEQEPSKV